MSYFRRYSRDEALVAAAAVAEAVCSVTGPNRARKLLLPFVADDPEGNDITSSTISVLRTMHMAHPASMILFRSALELHERFGCGLGTMVVLVREILTSAAAMLRSGVDSAILVSLLPDVVRVCNEEIEARARAIPIEDGKLHPLTLQGLARGAPDTIADAAIAVLQYLLDSSRQPRPGQIQRRNVQVICRPSPVWAHDVFKDTYAMPAHISQIPSGLMEAMRAERGGCPVQCVLVMGSMGVLHNFDVGHACDVVSKITSHGTPEHVSVSRALRDRYDKDRTDGEALGAKLAEATLACGGNVVLLGGDASNCVRRSCAARGVSLVENIQSGHLQDVAVFLGVRPMRTMETLETRPAVATVRLEWLGDRDAKEGHVLVHRTGPAVDACKRYSWQKNDGSQLPRCVVTIRGPISFLEADTIESFWVVLSRMCNASASGVVEGGGTIERRCAEALEKTARSSDKIIQDVETEMQSLRDICAGYVYGALADAMWRASERFSGGLGGSSVVCWDDKGSKIAAFEGACLICVRLLATDTWMVNGALGSHAASLAVPGADRRFDHRFGDEPGATIL